jgi:hypothetical protein
MHAVLITFTSSAPLSALHAPFSEYAQALTTMPGLIMKTWINDGATIGGFHIFETRDAAEGYLGSDLIATVLGNPSFSEFSVRHFDTIDDFSAINGSPTGTDTAHV